MKMKNSSRFPQLEVSGTPREMGRQIGEAACEQVRQFCEIALQQVNRTVRVSRATAERIAKASVAFAESYSLEMVEELRGIAEAARVSFDDVMLLQVRNQLQPDSDAGCTSLAMSGSSYRPTGN